MITIKNLYKSFGDVSILEDISDHIDREEVVALIGFSGSGKSTLLKILAGLESFDSGEVKLGSEKIGMAFQYSALFDSMTVAENVAFPLRTRGHKFTDKQISRLVSEKLKLVGLAGIEEYSVSSLSGGMKKRVGFARAIIDDPDIILYDEPTAGLDPVASTIVEDLIVKLQKETKAAALVVTHQHSTILRTASRVNMLYNREYVWSGCPKDLFDSANKNPFTKQFRNGEVQGPMAISY